MASIAKRPNGKWRARYRDNAGVEHARHFPTRSQGQRWLDEITADLYAGRYVDPRSGRITLGDYYQRYAARQMWQPSTRRAMDHAITTCPLTTTPLGQITPAAVEEWMKAMSDRGLAPATIRVRVAALRSVLAGAVRDRLRHDNPAVGVRLPRDARRGERIVLPSPAHIAALIKASPAPLSVAVDLAAHAGLRLGELRGLQVADLDLPAARLRVARQVRDLVGGGWELAAPKYDSVRTVQIGPEVAERLRAHLTGAGLRFSPAAFVIPGRGEGPVHAGTLARQWRTVKERTGSDLDLRLHDLRHYFASMLIAQGHSVIAVQLAMGHARPSTTLDLYTGLFNASGTPAAAYPAPFQQIPGSQQIGWRL